MKKLENSNKIIKLEKNKIAGEEKFRKYINDEELMLGQISKDIYISTMTISCKIRDIEFNCENICKYIDLSHDCVQDIVCAVSVGIEEKRNKQKNIIYRNIKNIPRKNKKVFYNQTSLHIKIKTKKEDSVHVKLFTNGSMHITGCRTCDDIVETISSIINELTKSKIIVGDNCGEIEFIRKINNNNIFDLTSIFDLKVNMINTNFELPFKVVLRKLYELLLLKKYDCFYDKISHSCVDIKFDHPQQIVSIFVYEDGSVVITGANTGEQINQAYIFINKFLYSNYKKIVKKDINVDENIKKTLLLATIN